MIRERENTYLLDAGKRVVAAKRIVNSVSAGYPTATGRRPRATSSKGLTVAAVWGRSACGGSCSRKQTDESRSSSLSYTPGIAAHQGLRMVMLLSPCRGF